MVAFRLQGLEILPDFECAVRGPEKRGIATKGTRETTDLINSQFVNSQFSSEVRVELRLSPRMRIDELRIDQIRCFVPCVAISPSCNSRRPGREPHCHSDIADWLAFDRYWPDVSRRSPRAELGRPPVASLLGRSTTA